jgi:CRP/FNR family transcriptional regulator, cyclic AMP receptor protein
VRVTAIDDDQQEVMFDEPSSGDFFGFVSMLDQTPHRTNRVAIKDTMCLEVDRDDIFTLIQQKPHTGMDMLAVLGQHLHAAIASR